MSIVRGLGPGTGTGTLQSGNLTAGYYGKVTGIITGADLFAATGTSEESGSGGTGAGISTPVSPDPTKGISGDITWLKFASNNKTIFVADRCLKYYVSWDYLQKNGLVFGKPIEIGGVKYLCRLMQGCNVNPAPNFYGSIPYTGVGTAIPGINNEWDNLIIPYTPLEADSHWTNVYSWMQEVHSYDLTYRVLRGYFSVSDFISNTSSSVISNRGWRPVLEVL